MLHIVSDSSCDLPDDLAKKHDVHFVPLSVNIDGKIYRERFDLSPREFYQKMASSRNLPRTSLPSPTAFLEVFTELSRSGPILCITISSGLSGTYASACRAKDISGLDVTVFDSLAGSLGHGLQIIKAAEMAASGHSLKEILVELEKHRNKMKILVLLNTLDNIVKGGRLSRFQGGLGKLLDIRILLHNDQQGKVVMKAKARGKTRFLSMVMQEIISHCQDFSTFDFGITHFNNLEDAEFIKKELLDKHHARSVIISEMGVTMATYAGEGGLIVSFL